MITRRAATHHAAGSAHAFTSQFGMLALMWGKLLVVLFALLTVGCSHPAPEYESRYTPAPPPPPIYSVGVIGDSFTRGTQDGGEGDQNWTVLVTQKLRDQGLLLDVTAAADSGSGYVEPSKKETVFADQVPVVAKSHVKLVVLFGSLTDASIPAERLAPAVTSTLDAVKAGAPNAKLLVIGPPWPDANPPERVLRDRDTVKAQAEAAGAVFVDPIAEGWLTDPALIGPDGIHPNNVGHQALANRIAPLIAAQLTTSPPQP